MFMQSKTQPHPYSVPSIFPHNKCFNNNFKGICDTPDSQYTHKCIMCSEGHPQFPVPALSLCFKQKLKKSTNHNQFHFPRQNQPHLRLPVPLSTSSQKAVTSPPRKWPQWKITDIQHFNSILMAHIILVGEDLGVFNQTIHVTANNFKSALEHHGSLLHVT